MLVDEFMPIYDVSDAMATVVEADVATTWDALMRVDLIDVGRKRPLVAVLGGLRILPDIVSHLLHGELPARQPEHLRFWRLVEWFRYLGVSSEAFADCDEDVVALLSSVGHT